MGFDQLPSRLGSIPAFQPITTTILPKPSIGPSIAQGVAGLVGSLAKANSPLEKAKEKLALSQLTLQTKALEDYQKGGFKSDEFYIGPDGLPKRRTEEDLLDLKNKRIQTRKREKQLQWDEDARNGTWNHIYKLPEPDLPQLEAPQLIPQG